MHSAIDLFELYEVRSTMHVVRSLPKLETEALGKRQSNHLRFLIEEEEEKKPHIVERPRIFPKAGSTWQCEYC